MDTDDIIRFSKTLTWLLRYKVVAYRLALTSDGYCIWRELEKYVPGKTVNDAWNMLQTNGKFYKWYQDDNNLYIKCKNGHSLAVLTAITNKVNMKPYIPASGSMLVYRTRPDILQLIQQTGVIRQGRKQFIYLTTHDKPLNNRFDEKNSVYIYLSVDDVMKKIAEKKLELYTHDGVTIYTYGDDNMHKLELDGDILIESFPPASL